jgi:ribosomal protein L11 methyltransferase
MSYKNNYIKFEFPQVSGEEQEFLIAELSDWPFEGFEEHPDQLIAYIPEKSCDREFYNFLKDLSHQKNWKQINKEIIEPVNWNEAWERDYEMVTVDKFCNIRANFHTASTEYKHEIIITPKMSFGTGHHATTYMMIKSMESVDFMDKSVFDFGCGTAVLAILAVKSGASSADALDYDHWAYENSVENIALNTVSDKIRVFHGDVESIPNNDYDIILANINRHVILGNMDKLDQRLKNGGLLLCSGFLVQDIQQIVESANENNLQLKSSLEKDNWSCLLFEKK